MIKAKYKVPMIVVGAAILALLAYGALTMSDKRDAGEKMGDAYHALSEGVDKAGRELEDRTPGQKLGDDLKDAGDKINDNTQPPDNH
ncbi:MAG: hypothetical protein P4M13_10785 [Alphaproteobacteria bacterium]|nr:hypothetical protein [Alphaproteobacteria bacterium]